MKKPQTFDSSYFRGKSHFQADGAQNYLVFQPIIRYFRINGKYILSWKSKGLSDETITPYATSDNSLTPLIDHYGTGVRLKFHKSCLNQPNQLTYDYGHKVNVYIVYELGASRSNGSDPTLKNCLFGAVTLTKNADIEKYGYSGFGIIFGVDMSSSSHINNKKKNILGLGKGPTQGLEHTLTAEKIYSINFIVTNKKIFFKFASNGAISYLFINGTEIYKFKAKYSEILVGPLCIGNISKDWSVDMKKTGFSGDVYDFGVDCDATTVNKKKK